MKSLMFYLKLIFGSLTLIFIVNFYILPIVKNFGVYLSMSGIQESAETIINRGYTRSDCHNLAQKIPKDSHHLCLKNAELMNVKYYPMPKGQHGIEAFYYGEYKNNVVCELHIGYNGGDPHDPYTCSFVSYDKIKNKNAPFGESLIYFRTKNRAEKKVLQK